MTPENHASLGGLSWKKSNPTQIIAANEVQTFEIEELKSSDLLLHESDGNLLLSLGEKKIPTSLSKPQFIHKIFSNPYGYLSPQSQIKGIQIYKEKSFSWWASILFTTLALLVVRLLIRAFRNRG